MRTAILSKAETWVGNAAFAPGMRYDYGPGCIYLEYLTQNGFIDRNGEVGEGDFDAIYLSVDFYL